MQTKPAAIPENLAIGELFDFNGHLAQYRGNVINPTEPTRTAYIAVSRIPTDEYRILLGRCPVDRNSNAWAAQVHTVHGNYVYCDCRDWERREEAIPVPMPRKGKYYTWTWAGWQGWQKAEYPRCDDCRKYHAPDKCTEE